MSNSLAKLNANICAKLGALMSLMLWIPLAESLKQQKIGALEFCIQQKLLSLATIPYKNLS